MTELLRCNVIGAGRMGTGIAHALLMSGATVCLSDVDSALAASGRVRVEAMLDASEQRGAPTAEIAGMRDRLSVGADADGAFGCDLVIEAVPESPSLKLGILSAIEGLAPAACVIASNTSSISINELSTALQNPARFLGMHFFNPVPASKLVEIVTGRATSEAAVERVKSVVAAMGKRAIVVADSPGFASSRLGLALGLEAIRMVQEQVASAEDIDLAMTFGYKHPVGPLRLTDMVGLDVRLDIAEYLCRTLGDRFTPPALLREMVERGHVGQKAGQGFYTW